MKGFIEFIREKGVVGLVVGFMMGGAITKLVSALVDDLINPFIGLVFGGTKNLAEASWTVGETMFKWGDFLARLIDFVIIAAVVYFVFRGLGLEKLDRKKDG